MKQRIINYLLRSCLNAVVTSDVITIDKGVIKLEGKNITEDELRQLIAEVKALEHFRIWSIMTNSLKFQAQDKMFNKALDFDDTMAGKLILYAISLQENIMKVIKSRV